MVVEVVVRARIGMLLPGGAKSAFFSYDNPIQQRGQRHKNHTLSDDTMAGTVDLSQAEAQFEELVERAAAGEEIVITVGGVPRARLVPLANERAPRQPGGWKGQIWVAEDFDDPLPPEILRGFYGEDNEGLPQTDERPRPLARRERGRGRGYRASRL